MNKRLPYEEELLKQLMDLPLPDEQVSWNDMKRRLDEDNDDGIIIPPVKKGCIAYGLLLVLLVIILVLIVRPGKWFSHRKEKNIVSSEKVIQGNDEKNGTKDTGTNFRNATQGNNADSVFSDSNMSLIFIDTSKPDNNKERNQNNYLKEKTAHGNGKKLRILTNKNESEKKHDREIKQNVSKNIAGNLKSTITNNQQDEDSSLNDVKINTAADNDSSITNSNKNVTQSKISDSNNIKKGTKNADSTNKITKKDSSIKPLTYFSAGLVLHQQLPVNGEKLTPYNSLGRKSSLADYIPSVYFRMYKEKKWFIQSEFRYGAPQYTKEILYIQRKVIDTSTNTTTSTSNRLKKTFYHQLPVSFNYYVLPHCSVGVGFTWNKFSSVVIEQEVKETNNITMIDSNQATTILHSGKPDSNFVKSYFQAVIETQYEWKRFSFGARYSFGLQPYLKFQLPGGQQKEEKNNALQIFVRYNLWESKKK